jgi:hypothetical protein
LATEYQSKLFLLKEIKAHFDFLACKSVRYFP